MIIQVVPDIHIVHCNSVMDGRKILIICSEDCLKVYRFWKALTLNMGHAGTPFWGYSWAYASLDYIHIRGVARPSYDERDICIFLSGRQITRKDIETLITGARMLYFEGNCHD